VRDIHAFQGGEREFRAWVLSIAHHRLLDERRRRRRHPVQVVHALLAAEEVGGDVEEETMARMGDGRVRTALSRLPSAQRSVIMLRVIGDLSVEEVARVNGKTPGAVKQLQRRALITLKRELGTVTVTP
jgi:RNA polymerase sigma-70 factor (ECF subfamily)